jgi:hypothetical protein
MRDAFYIHLFEQYKPLSKKPQGPTPIPFWWITAGQGDEVGFCSTIQGTFVCPVGWTTVDRRFKTLLGESFAYPMDGC